MQMTVAIIAGGNSSRMGTDKAFVKLANKPLIEHVVERTSDLGQTETMLIANQPDAYAHLGLPIYTDVQPNKGPLGGIYTALTYSSNPFTLMVACDMPFLNPDLLKFMMSKISESVDIVVPRVDGYPQGLHAIYGQTCLVPIEAQLAANRLKIIRFYDQMRVCYLDEADYQAYDPEKQSFANLNTPEELDKARNQLK